MSYQFPEGLNSLRDWLRSCGADVGSMKTERQAAFMAQQLLGTRFKFPEKGRSCFPVLQSIQRALPSLETVSSEPVVPGYGHHGHTFDRRKPGKLSADRPQIDRTVPAGLVIYSDGSCDPNPGPGGWSFVVYRDGVETHEEHGGAPATTNNQMEMTGALMALRWFADRGIVEPVRLLSDSQYVVKGCNEWRSAWKRKGWKRGEKLLANADIWRELDDALLLVPIRLEWVRGHVGNIGNERADELAEMGRPSSQSVSAKLITEQLRVPA